MKKKVTHKSGRNLHVHARYYYVRDFVYDEQCEIVKICTSMQIADIGCTYKGVQSFVYLSAFLMECARIVCDEGGSLEWEERCVDAPVAFAC